MIFPTDDVEIASRLNRVLQESPVLSQSAYAVQVRRADGTVVFDRNGDLRLVPASNQKIFSTLFALYVLGTEYRPETHIWSEKGRIVVSTDGNPLLTQDDLREIASQPDWDRNRPVEVFQAYRPGVPATWEYDDLANRYASPVYAFTVDMGGFEVWAEKGKLLPIPREFGLSVTHEWTKRAAKLYYDPMRRKLTVIGTLPEERTRMDTLAQPAPHETASRILGNAYRPLGQVPTTPPDIVLKSKAANLELVKLCLQPSDNQLAEQLMLMAAHQQGMMDPDDPYPTARKRMKDFLTLVVGIDPNDLNPMDGSGLSRHNLLTARSLNQALLWAERQSWGAQYRAALARPGVGTLSSRLAGSSFEGKTGTLSGVVSLSGYVSAMNGEQYTVSIVTNHTVASSAQVRGLADSIVRTLENTSTPGTGVVYSGAHARFLAPILPDRLVVASSRDWVR